MADSSSEEEQDAEEMARLKEATAGVDKITTNKPKEKKDGSKDNSKDGSARYLSRLLDNL